MCKKCKPQKADIFHMTHSPNIGLQKIVSYQDPSCDPPIFSSFECSLWLAFREKLNKRKQFCVSSVNFVAKSHISSKKKVLVRLLVIFYG